MRPIGYSTGALAPGDVRRALEAPAEPGEIEAQMSLAAEALEPRL